MAEETSLALALKLTERYKKDSRSKEWDKVLSRGQASDQLKVSSTKALTTIISQAKSFLSTVVSDLQSKEASVRSLTAEQEQKQGE